MIEHTKVDVSGERFAVTYCVHASAEDARAIAEKACIEQTVEFPPELIQDDDIRGHIFGRIEDFSSLSPTLHHAKISYAVETTGFQLTQLLNVAYGNISLFPSMRIERFDLPESLAAAFKGPRFGREGLRRLFGEQDGPLFMSAIKPQGLPSKALAQQAYDMAMGGLDMVKDDHGLANQPYSPFKERVTACAQAVAQANAKTGSNTLYTPMISAPSEHIIEMAHFAKEAGAGAFLVSPALVGFDMARRIAEDDALGLPVIGHPALMGSYAVSPTNGFSHGALFGQLMRMIGMDASIFPNFGGRFSFSKDECRRIAESCAAPMNEYAPILPTPGGGMRFDTIGGMAEFYGKDVMYLMGGDLHQHGDLTGSCRRLREIAERATAL